LSALLSARIARWNAYCWSPQATPPVNNPLTVRESTADAFAIMDDNDIRVITVVDGAGKPLGFVKRRETRQVVARNFYICYALPVKRKVTCAWCFRGYMMRNI